MVTPLEPTTSGEQGRSGNNWVTLVCVSLTLLVWIIVGIIVELKVMSILFALLLAVSAFTAGYRRRASQEPPTGR